MFRRFFKDRNDEEDYTVKLCFHCGRDGEYEGDEDTCKYCGFPF